jgi:Ca2+:H+ antiporter
LAEVEEHGGEASWSLPRAVATLILASVFVAFMSEILVGAVEETAKTLGMSQAFIGIVVLAVVGGAAESSSAVVMGIKNRMDLSVSIAIGSSIQIALFVAPVLLLASYFMAPQPLNLVFSRGLLGAVLLTVLIGAMVAGDGKANWFKGVQLITVYVIMAVMFYFLPGSP